MAYKIYKQKPLIIIAEQQESGNYMVITCRAEGKAKDIELSGGQIVNKDYFENNYEEVEDA